MRIKRLLSFILLFAMLISVFPQIAFASEGKDSRTIYLYAQSESDKTGEPAISNPSNRSVVYTGETANVYLAIDNPNKSKLDAEGNPINPQYNLNGYTVKIYFDPEYFDLAADSESAPIDYDLPDELLDDSIKKDEDVSGIPVPDVPTTKGYYVYKHGYDENAYNGYSAAYITVFANGGYFPNSKDESKWYNLLKLPLTPKEDKAGSSTDIFIDADGLDDGNPEKDFRLELFAKNTTDKLEEQTFDFSVINGGRHTIIIRDRVKPAPPVATPTAGRYSEAQKVTLTAEDGCEIWYKKSGEDNYTLYAGEEIEVSVSGSIFCYAFRPADSKRSTEVDYSYTIVPKSPVLFDGIGEGETLISYNYSKSSAFTVYASDNEAVGKIDDSNEVYYTFASLSEEELLNGTSNDPEKADEEWVKVDRRTRAIEITKNTTVRLITVKLGEELSDITEYNLGISPAKVTAVPSGYPDVYTEKQDVTLSTSTENAVIYYTLDGKDPRNSGLEYIDKITLTNDTVVKAVAYYDGRYGEVSTFTYIFDYYADDGITAFYPPGVYEGSVDVTLVPNNPDNKVEYSTDGGNTWIQDDTLVIDKDTELYARIIDEDENPGEAQRIGRYSIKPLPPQFAPESTQFTNADKITLYCVESTEDTDSRYELYYTLDGSDPITSNTREKATGAFDTAIIDINGYTQVRAVVLKDGESYSTVVTHSYDVVTLKPVKPITTLLPGNYTREIGDTEGFTTQFMPVPDGTEIYYTIGDNTAFLPDPVPNTDGTIKYTPGEEIEIKGNQIIKAVAVNVFNTKSDIGIFEYTITPEAPKAPPSAKLYADSLPEITVSAVIGSDVTYTLNDGEAVTVEDCSGSLTIDLSDCGDEAVLKIYSTLDGVNSYTATYVYTLTPDSTYLAPPYADKETGSYEEIDRDGNNNYLLVNLYSINNIGEIEYRINEGGWEAYDGGSIAIKNDTVLQVRCVDGENKSTTQSYVYTFYPLAPVIELESGRYSIANGEQITTTISYDNRIPTDVDYNIFYRRNGDTSDFRYMDYECEIDHTMSFKAYVRNEETGRVSKNTINYYIIESEQVSGGVYVASPYNVDRVSSHLLATGDWADGIKLVTQNKDASIHYKYSYTKVDGVGTPPESNELIYDAATPIMVNATFDDITITAWLVDKDGNTINGSKRVYKIDFVPLKVPATNLGTDKTEFSKGTKFTIINDYPENENIKLYYSLDGTDPTSRANEYNGEELSINGETIVKAVYYSSCGYCVFCKDGDVDNCLNSVFGEVGRYRYTNPTVVSSGGGGGGYRGGGTTTIDNTRAYTVDIFGIEHPTHIGYINGYPDGSVKPDGNITREEVTAVLYRVRYDTYDEPFAATGDVFPDVDASRWSVKDIEFMADKEVILGYPDGEFKPENNLTRAEFAALIRRFTGLAKPSGENIFNDLDETHWAYEDIMIMLEAGLMQGYEDGSFNPQKSITRAEVMKVINIILGRCPDESYVKDLDFNPFNDLDKDAWHYVTVLEATVTHDYYLNNDESLEIKWENWK